MKAKTTVRAVITATILTGSLITGANGAIIAATETSVDTWQIGNRTITFNSTPGTNPSFPDEIR